MTEEIKKVAWPSRVFRSAEEINDVRRRLGRIVDDPSQPAWRVTLAAEICGALAWVMVDPDELLRSPIDGSVSNPADDLQRRNCAPLLVRSGAVN